MRKTVGLATTLSNFFTGHKSFLLTTSFTTRESLKEASHLVKLTIKGKKCQTTWRGGNYEATHFGETAWKVLGWGFLSPLSNCCGAQGFLEGGKDDIL